MRKHWPVLFLCLLCAPVTQAQSGDVSADTGTTIRKQVREVMVYFTATGRHGQPVDELEPGDVVVEDNSQPVSELRGFQSLGGVPLELGILLDVSGSTQSMLQPQAKAAERFLKSALRENDEAFVSAFGERYRELIRVKGGGDQSLPEVHSTDSATALFDAIVNSMASFQQGTETRRVLMVMSDGQDTLSYHSLADAIRAARRAGVTIYAVSVKTRQWSKEGQAVLEKLAAATGGDAFAARGMSDLEEAFGNIRSAMSSQYSACFAAPDSDAAVHSLQVKSKIPDIQIRARPSYTMNDCR